MAPLPLLDDIEIDGFVTVSDEEAIETARRLAREEGIFGGFSWITGKAQWALKDGKEHPLKVVGYVAGAIVFLVFVGWQLASSAFLPTAA